MEEPPKIKEKLLPSTRLGVAIVWFYAAITLYVVRNNFGVSIVCMTIDTIENDTSTNDTTDVMVDDQCEAISQTGYETGEFYWDRTTRGLLNSGFYMGYFVTNLLGGIVAQKLGVKWVHFGGMAVATVATVLCPVSGQASEWGLMAMRILLGLGCGVFVPTMTEMVNSWSPKAEKSRLYSIHTSGAPVGSVIAFSMSGALCENLGWQSTFYVPAIFAGVYLVIVVFLVSNGPENFKYISDKERDHIMKERTQKTGERLSIPWVGILTSVPCWNIFICNFCVAWGSQTIITSGAQYMNDVLKFDIKSNGGFNALPQLCKFVLTLFAGYFVDLVTTKKWLSTINSCKLAQTIAMPVSAAMMIGMGFMTCSNRGAAIAMLCIGEGFSGFNLGIPISLMAIAPRFVPVIVGVGNSFSQLAGTISPIVVGVLTPNGTQEEWQIVFMIGAAIYMFGWLAFVLFATTEVQPWAVSEEGIVSATRAKNKEIALDSNHSQIVGMSYIPLGKSNDGFVDGNSADITSMKIMDDTTNSNENINKNKETDAIT